MISHAVVVRPWTSHPYEAGSEHAGFSSDNLNQAITKRRDLFGELHLG